MPAPRDEQARLSTLRSLELIGTPPSPDFDGIVALTTRLFKCPIAWVSLVDDQFQWFKAISGSSLQGTARNISFCNQTIMGNDITEIVDTLRDERFCRNPLVIGEPFIRFYSGMPIRYNGGHNIGALCVIGHEPRQLTEEERLSLRTLAIIVESLVAAHKLALQAIKNAAIVADSAKHLERNRLLLQIERMAQIGGWEFDLRTNHIYWSDEAFRIHEAPNINPPTLEQTFSFYHGEAGDLVRRSFRDAISLGKPFDVQADIVTGKGNARHVHILCEVERIRGKPVKLIGMFGNITEQRQLEEKLWRLAYFDDLTGVANRKLFREVLGDRLTKATAENHPLALFILDLDGFKEINDTRGHPVGDQVLQIIAKRLENVPIENIFVARLGGDEFAVVISGTRQTARIKTIGRKLLSAIKRPMKIRGEEIHVSGSFGVAMFPVDALVPSELLRRADMALYNTKHNDRGSIHCYVPKTGGIFDEKRTALEVVRRALASNRLLPHYQPKIDLSTGKISGFEALVRIESPDGEIMVPAQFWPALQDRDTARRVGERMLARVTSDIAAWLDAELRPGIVSINACEADFAGGSFAERVLRRLAQMDIPTSLFTIEVTETVFLGEQALLVGRTLEKLSAAGVQIALDDFGTGFASLTHLRHFPIDRLKIDQTFVKAIGKDHESSLIIESIIDLGHNLGLKIVAEGVETEMQAKFLGEHRCDYGQGYLFGRPISFAAATDAIYRKDLNESASEEIREAPRLIA